MILFVILFIYFLIMNVLHGAHGGQKRVSNLLELALQMGANHQDNWELNSVPVQDQ